MRDDAVSLAVQAQMITHLSTMGDLLGGGTGLVDGSGARLVHC